MTSTESRFAFFGIMLGIAGRIDAAGGPILTFASRFGRHFCEY